MRSTRFQLLLVTGLTGGLGLYGCSSNEPGTGGSGGAATGGTSSTGGAQNGTGGVASGGQASTTGGNATTGGSNSVGGNSSGGTTTSTGGSGQTGGAQSSGGTSSSGGGSATGGAAAGGAGTGGAATGGAATGGGGGKASGGSSNGGTSTTGGSAAGGSTSTGGSGTGGSTGTRGDGPCDIYAAGSTPCVAAYSMIRALSKTYSGPLYQVRSGSSAANTGSGGMLKDIGMTADGFADTAAQDAFCSGTICTVAKLYDQSGNGNNLTVAKKGLSNGGTYAAMDDFESSATKGKLKVSGHDVYPLYMAAREGYRLAAVGKNMPRGTAAQGIYMLADGTHSGTTCCWDFGNVTTDPTKYGVMNTLFFGVAFWGNGAGSGPWFMADFEAGVWAGGSKAGDPGWGALDGAHPANPSNPSMKVPYAFGILKTTPTNYTLRSGNGQSGMLSTSYDGALPKAMDNLGGIVLGVGGDNSNNSWGTFFEGAITAGAPSSATDAAILSNVQAAKYGQ